MLYQASPIKRKRATKAEMEARAQFFIEYAQEHGPVTVRGLYYQAEVAALPGIDKTESGYNKTQNHCLKLRRAGRMPYAQIADATRYMRRPRTFDGMSDALEQTARLYRKSLWTRSDIEVEIWIEKSALAGVIQPITFEYDVPLMPTGGYSSETFAFEAVDDLRDTGKTLVIYSLYDFDRSGKDAERSLQEKVERFGRDLDVPVIFNSLGLNFDQVTSMRLPTRPHKRNAPADRAWPYDFACELDAIPPDALRAMVRNAIEYHLPRHELEALQKIERAERETLLQFISYASEDDA